MILSIIERHERIIAMLVYSVLVGGLFAWTSSDAFRFDDASHIWFVDRHPWWGMLVDRELAYTFSRNNYTPFNVLIYEVGLALFGETVRAYYALYCLILWICALLSHVLLRQALPPWAAIGAVGLFLVAPATWYVSGQLTVSHYVLGMLFALLHTRAFIAHIKRPRVSMLAASIICYLLAALSKEIYVVWPAALLLLPLGRLKERLLALLWHVPALTLYLWLRTRALGGMGGYTYMQPGELLALLQGLAVVPSVAFGKKAIGIAAMLAVVVGYALAWWRKPRETLWASGALVLILAPLLAVVKFPGLSHPDRYFFLLWWFIAMLVGLFAKASARSWQWGALYAVVLIAAVVQTRKEATEFMPTMRSFDALNRFLASPSAERRIIVLPSPDDYVAHVSTRYAAFLQGRYGGRTNLVGSLDEARRMGPAPGGVWVFDDSRSGYRRVDLDRTEGQGIHAVSWRAEAIPANPDLLRGYFLGEVDGKLTRVVVEGSRLIVEGELPPRLMADNMHIRVFAPVFFTVRHDSPSAVPANGNVGFAFEAVAQNGDGMSVLRSELCVAVTSDFEYFAMLAGSPSHRCADYLRSSGSN